MNEIMILEIDEELDNELVGVIDWEIADCVIRGHKCDWHLVTDGEMPYPEYRECSVCKRITFGDVA